MFDLIQSDAQTDFACRGWPRTSLWLGNERHLIPPAVRMVAIAGLPILCRRTNGVQTLLDFLGED